MRRKRGYWREPTSDERREFEMFISPVYAQSSLTRTWVEPDPRASKGWRRHVRREKAMKRKEKSKA